MNNIEVMLAELAEKLGTTIEHLWGILLNQSFIFGVSTSIITILMIIFLIFAFYYIKKITNKKRKSPYEEYTCDEEYIFVCQVLFGCCLVIFPIGILYNLYEIITAFANPEYWALKTILKSI